MQGAHQIQNEKLPSTRSARRSDTDAHSMTSPVSALSPAEAFLPQSPHSPTGFAATMPLFSSHSPTTTATAMAAAAALTSRRKVTPFSIENLLNSRERQERERIIEMGIKEEGEEE